MAEIDTLLRVATADGRGAARFLAAALRDALDGNALSAVVRTDTGVDFVFGDAGERPEIIRVHLDAEGGVLGAEILRGR